MSIESAPEWVPPVVHYLADVETTDSSGSSWISLYRCNRCEAVVRDDEGHIAWHKDLNGLKTAITLVAEAVSLLIGKRVG